MGTGDAPGQGPGRRERHALREEIPAHDLVVTTYALLRRDIVLSLRSGGGAWLGAGFFVLIIVLAVGAHGGHWVMRDDGPVEMLLLTLRSNCPALAR